MNAIKIVLASLLALASVSAGAVPVLTLTSASSVTQGEVFTVDAIVSGQVDELVGAFDLTVEWDTGAFSLIDVFFGQALDGANDSLQGFDQGANYLNAFEVSFSDLASQSGNASINLFSFSLRALRSGLEGISFSASAPQVLSDELGFAYELGSLNGASITVSPPVVGVDEPAVLTLSLLAMLGLGLLTARRWRDRQ